MKISVKYHGAEVEVEMPDFGVDTTATTTNSGYGKNDRIYERDKRTHADVVIAIIAECCKGINEMRKGGQP
jgi:hypothetical protein